PSHNELSTLSLHDALPILVALEESPKQLPEDHANAKRLAEGVAELVGVKIDPEKVVTNIVIFDVAETGQTADAICAQLGEHDILDRKSTRLNSSHVSISYA